MKEVNSLRLVFFGSSKYSCIAAEIIKKRLGLSLIVTHPDKPAGRKRKLRESPVKEFAHKNKLPCLTFEKLNKEAISAIAKVQPDFLVVSDYGLILPKELLTLPKYKALNIHHSLLPKYRGPSPAPATILAGEKKSGVTVIEMTEKVDAGPILSQKPYALKPDETFDSLLTELNKLGAQLAIEVIKGYPQGKIKPRKQNESQVSFTHRFKKEDGYISLDNPPDPETFNRMIRAFYPWPGVWTEVESRKSKVKIIKFLPGNLIQPEGKRPLTISEFKNGYPTVYEQIKHIFSPKAQS